MLSTAVCRQVSTAVTLTSSTHSGIPRNESGGRGRVRTCPAAEHGPFALTGGPSASLSKRVGNITEENRELPTMWWYSLVSTFTSPANSQGHALRT